MYREDYAIPFARSSTGVRDGLPLIGGSRGVAGRADSGRWRMSGWLSIHRPLFAGMQKTRRTATEAGGAPRRRQVATLAAR